MANTITWYLDDSGLTTTYNVYRSDDEGGVYSLLQNVAHPTDHYVDPTGQDYHWYRMSATGPDGESPLGAPMKADSTTMTIGSLTYSIAHSPNSNNVYIVPVSGSFDYNYEYTITVASGLLSETETTGPQLYDYSFTFTSEYYPRYATPETIRTNAGPILNAIPDDTLYRMILKNGIWIEGFAAKNGVSIDRANPPQALTDYVECKTTKDALDAVLLALTPAGGRKTLGDLTISKDFNTDILSDARKAAIDCIESAKRWFFPQSTYAIPHLNDPRPHPPYSAKWGRYPDTRRRSTRTGERRTNGPWATRGINSRTRWE